MARQLRIGFIGTGGIAEKQAESLLRQKIENVSIVAAANANERSLANFCAQYGIPRQFSAWQELIASEGVEAVSICTPNSLHYEPTMSALHAGKHVLVEKPMSVTAAEADKMVTEAQKTRKLLMVAFQHRFTPEAQMLRAYVHDGTFGDIVYVRAQALRRRGIPSWGVFGRKEMQGGGSLIDIGVHVMEMAHYIMGSPKPLTAVGSIHTYLGDKPCQTHCRWGKWDHTAYTVEDLGIGFLTFDNGATMTVETSFAAHLEEDLWCVQVMGTKGGGTTNPAKVFFDQGKYMVTAIPAFLEKRNEFDFKMRHFCECILNGIPCQAPAEDGATVQRMLEGLYVSAEKREQVRL